MEIDFLELRNGGIRGVMADARKTRMRIVIVEQVSGTVAKSDAGLYIVFRVLLTETLYLPSPSILMTAIDFCNRFLSREYDIDLVWPTGKS